MGENVRNLRMHEEGGRDVDQVQRAERQRQLFPGPITPVQHHDRHQQADAGDREPGGHAENRQRRGHADELGDQSQPVDEQQVEQREPAPERAKAIEDRFGVAPLGHRPQPNRHFLDVIGDRPEDHEEPDQRILILCAGRRIGGDAAGVIVGDHHHDARPCEHQVQADRLEPALQPVIEAGNPTHSLLSPPAPCRPARRGTA